MGITSPRYGFELVRMAGDADTLESAGREYQRMGSRMTWTADELSKLANATKYKSKAVDTARESAGELSGELKKAAERYSGTGPVLVEYSIGLRDAQRVVNPLVEPILVAFDRHASAVSDREDAEWAAGDTLNAMSWSPDTTQGDVDTAEQDASDARATERARAAELEDLWESFESGCSTWLDAYNRAVHDLQEAYDASGISDNPWEDFFDGLAGVLTVIGTIAVIIAIVATGPIALIALAVATVAALATLVIHVSMMAAGSHRVNGWDIAFDLVALVPFGGGVVKAMKGGTRFFPALISAAGGSTATRSVLNVGRNAVEDGLRTIAGAGGVNGGQAARAANAGGIADRFLSESTGSWGRGAWNAIRSGGAKLDGTLLSMSERVGSAWPTSGSARIVATRWAQEAGTAGWLQGVNVFNFSYGLEQSVSAIASPFGIDIPTLSDLPGLDNPLARPL
jgi:hypothetical protein